MSSPADIVRTAEAMRWRLPRNYQDRLTEAIYAEAARIAEKSVARRGTSRRLELQVTLDKLLTGPWTGLPIIALCFAVVLWLTISGANVPSGMLADLLMGKMHPWLHGIAHAHLW